MNQPSFQNCDVGDTVLVSNAPADFPHGDQLKVFLEKNHRETKTVAALPIDDDALEPMTFRRMREHEQTTDRVQIWLRID